METITLKLKSIKTGCLNTEQFKNKYPKLRYAFDKDGLVLTKFNKIKFNLAKRFKKYKPDLLKDYSGIVIVPFSIKNEKPEVYNYIN